MRFVSTLYHQSEIGLLATLGTDVYLVNTVELSTKAPHAFSRAEIVTLIDLIHAIGKKIYIHLNTMIHEGDLPVLSDYLDFLALQDIDGIVCFDLSVLAMAAEKNLAAKVIYRPGTLNTNSYDPWFFRKMKIKGITLSKDITLEELISIGENYQGMEISIVGHGYLFLFYSKRPLLLDYFEYKKQHISDFLNNESFRLQEKSRKEGLYPIYEDAFGTHIFRAKKLQSFNELNVMRPYLADFFLERIFYDDQEYYASIAAYQDELKETSFLNTYGREYDSGFYYTKTKTAKGAIPE